MTDAEKRLEEIRRQKEENKRKQELLNQKEVVEEPQEPEPIGEEIPLPDTEYIEELPPDEPETEEVTQPKYNLDESMKKFEGKTIKEQLDMFFQEESGSPLMFKKSATYALLSMTVGQYFKNDLQFEATDPKRGIVPVTWFIVAGIPKYTFRSTIMNRFLGIYKRAMHRYRGTEQLPEEHEEYLKTEKYIDDTIIEDGTPEGIADHIGTVYKETKNKNYNILSDEFGSVLEKTKLGSYESGLPVLYSKLYDGKDTKQMLSDKGKKGRSGPRYIPSGCYVTMFCSIQEPRMYLTPTMLGQGMIRRLKIMYQPTAKMKFETDYRRADAKEFANYKFIEFLGDRLGDLMKTYSKHPNKWVVHFNEDIKDKVLDLDEDIAKQIMGREERDIDSAILYMSNRMENARLISMLEAIGRKEFDRLPGGVKVNKDDFKRAMSFISIWEESCRDIIRNISKKEQKKTFDITEDLRAILDFMNQSPDGKRKKSPAGEATITELHRKFQYDEFDGHLKKLVGEEKIVCKQFENPQIWKVVSE